MINNLQNNQQIEGFFIVLKKEILTARNNKKYLNLTIGDKSGQINAKMWDIESDYKNINEEDVVYLKGKVDKFKDNLQIILEFIEKREVSEDIINNLIATTGKNIEEMYAQLIILKNSIDSKLIKKLIDRIFKDDFLTKFKLAPAATNFHHAYRGGLLEHTLSVATICDKFSTIYKNINRDLLISGAILHDIGKVVEYNNKTFKRTDEGRLIGHIAIGITIVDKKAGKLKDFPENILNAIKHLILSHHGELEWGSPVQPATAEALLLHYADNIDSKIQTFLELEEDKNGWQYNKSLRRKVFIDNNLGERNKKTIF